MPPARLILEDGSSFPGESFGSETTAIGEVVFNTSLTGYQEIVTDPSYRFQIVVMTYPHIGNYGVDERVEQSERPQAAGLVVRELHEHPDHFASSGSLGEYARTHDLPGIQGVDTRAITRKIRVSGAMKGMITSEEISLEEAMKRLATAPSMSGLDLVQKVTALRPYAVETEMPERRIRVAVYDFGVKRDILRQLARRGADVVVYPASTHPDEILNAGFDGLLLSNGPGDPEPVEYAQQNIRQMIGRIPILGICLGHQLLGLALGGRTYKLKFGHRGGNHPVRDLASGKVEITSQNHGFSVDPDSLPDSEVELTHVNLNDGTLEGFRHRNHPLFAVQYHPEAAPGPHDSFHLFDDFMKMIAEWKK
ncbi:MAG: glutamine-hydrolyzing carbamoyl-phosphate synthase small subunit [Thermoanaerobaculia bacterium]